MIKKMFFEGEIPVNIGKVEISNNTLSDPLTQLQGAKDLHQVIYKEVGSLQTIRDTQASQRMLQSQIVQTQQEITQQTNQLSQQLQTQQQINTKTQTGIIQQLATTQQQLAEAQKKLSGK
jgi:hypothetical protein